MAQSTSKLSAVVFIALVLAASTPALATASGAEWAELRGPVQSCGVKQFPGLADFVRHTAPRYNRTELRVIQRVCDPFVQFLRWRDADVLASQFGFSDPVQAPEGLRREILEEVPIANSHSEEDIVDMLAERGIALHSSPSTATAQVNAQ